MSIIKKLAGLCAMVLVVTSLGACHDDNDSVVTVTPPVPAGVQAVVPGAQLSGAASGKASGKKYNMVFVVGGQPAARGTDHNLNIPAQP